MKISILTDSISAGGGAGVIAWNHARALKDHGHDVSVVVTSANFVEEGIKEENGIIIYTIHSNYRLLWRAYKSLNNPVVVRKVKNILEKIKPDIVHAHNLHLHLSYRSLRIAREIARGVFLTVHDAMPFHYSKLFPGTVRMRGGEVLSYKVPVWEQFRLFKWQFNPLRNIIIKKYLKIPDKIFAVSGALASALSDNGIGNVEILHNAIDVTEWKNTPIINGDGKDLIFFGGRLSAVKGGDIIMEAIQDILPEKPNTRLLVVGVEDKYTEEMKNKSKGLGRDDLILFTGWKKRDQMKDMYPLSTLVVVPSLCFDWFPTVVLEAMASGRPVIVGCFGGAKELVIEGKTGFVVNPRNPKELLDKILYLLHNKKKADEMGRAGYERVKDHFSMEKYMETLLSWYDKAFKK